MRLKPYHILLAILTGAASFLFWMEGAPGMLNYHEQNQLFLFTPEHLAHALSLPGGLADYLAEAGIQLAYYPILGALWMTVIATLLFLLLHSMIEKLYPHYDFESLPLVAIVILGTCSVRWTPTYPVALLLVLTAAWLTTHKRGWYDLLLIPALYWITGPVAWLYPAWRIVTMGYTMIGYIPYIGLIYAMAAMCLTQWPWQVVLSGIHYRTDVLQAPWPPHLLTALILFCFCYVKGMYLSRRSSYYLFIPLWVVLLAALRCCMPNRSEMEMLRLDMLVRHGQWEEVIQRVRRHPVPSPFTSQCVNLALGMTGQLPHRMFDFYQDGPEALLMPMVRDNVSDLPTAEAFFHLGMNNEALRYTMDLQQSILTYKRSGRCTKRLAECHLVNGNHTAAAKELQWLEHSLFYRSWAKETKRLIGHDNLVEQHPLYGRLRKLRFKENFLYNYNERHKMLGLLFVSHPENRLALDYHMAQLLLNGDIGMLMQSMPWVQQYGGYSQMPYSYRDALEYAQQKKSAAESPYGQYMERLQQTAP